MLADLIRRPWDTRGPAFTAHLHVTAALAARPAESGEVTGQPATAAHVRELLAQLGVLGRPEPAEAHDPTATQDDLRSPRDRTCRSPTAADGPGGPTATTSSPCGRRRHSLRRRSGCAHGHPARRRQP